MTDGRINAGRGGKEGVERQIVGVEDLKLNTVILI